MAIESAFTRRRFLAAAGIAVAGAVLPVRGRAQPAGPAPELDRNESERLRQLLGEDANS